MTSSSHSFNSQQNFGISQGQQEIRSLWTMPPPRWPRYTPLLVLVGILGGTAWAYLQSRPVSIGYLVGAPFYISRCDSGVRTWGVVSAEPEEPGFDGSAKSSQPPSTTAPADEDPYLRGYWLEDRNELGLESHIEVLYNPAKISAPAVGQALRVAGVLECSVTRVPEPLTLIEQSRTVQQNITPTLGSP
jgi:hypothetical protein